jgi:hypothetical protein
MSTTVEGMTLKDLLKQRGILAASELRRRIVDEQGKPLWSRAQAWNLWSGKVGVGKETMRLLHDKLGISYDDLMEVDTVPARKPKSAGEEDSPC